MDELDQRILAALAADSSISTARLGRRFKTARSTIQARIERLERTGVIAGYTVKLGQAAAVRRVRATVLVAVLSRATAGVVAALRAQAAVEIIHTTAGTHSLIVQVAGDTTQTLDDALDAIGAIDGVTATETHIHLATRLDRAM